MFVPDTEFYPFIGHRMKVIDVDTNKVKQHVRDMDFFNDIAQINKITEIVRRT